MLFARGRGLGILIDGISKGDPTSIAIGGVAVAVMIGIFVFKANRS